MKWRKSILPTLTLFGSFSTLICCALPALLVSLGAGAALAGLVSSFPQLVWLSEHKLGLFIFAGAMLLISGTSRYMTRHAFCPIDPEEAKACMRLRRSGRWVFMISTVIYVIGFFFAFLAKYFI